MDVQTAVNLVSELSSARATLFGLVTDGASLERLAMAGLVAVPAVVVLTAGVVALRAKNGVLSRAKSTLEKRCLKLLGLADELELARERMADLYKVQLEGSKKRAEKLTKILEVASSINSNLDLDTVLYGVVSAVRETLGFRIVLLRVLNPQTGLLDARAFAGLDVDARRKLENYPVPVEEFRSWLKPEFRISRSYFISHTHGFWDEKDDEGSYVPNLGPRQEGEWHEEDVLFVPLVTREDKLIAYLSVDDPADRMIPSLETIEMLEIFGAQAVAGMENARLYKELEEHTKRIEEAAERMRELNELKTNFVSTVSHELRTPLTSIKAYVETLLDSVGARNEDMQREFLHIIDGETDRLARLIDAILDLSQLESGTFRIRKEIFDAAEVIREAVDVLRSVAERREINLEVDLPARPVLLEADRDLVKQVIINLAGNAVKFTCEGGQVSLGVCQQGPAVKVKVEDTGVGIPREQLDRIFDRFYQVDNSTARQFGGAGLGLTICKSIVEWHGGTIEVESEEGEGSKFVVTFPQKAMETRALANVEHNEDRTIESIAKLTVEMIAEVMNAKTASLMLLDDELQELTIKAALGLEDHVVKNTAIKVGESISGWVAKHGKPLLIGNIEEDERFDKVNHPQYETKSLLSVPIMWDNEVIGVININNKVSCAPFTTDDSVLLACLAERVGLVCRNLESYKATRNVAEGTKDALRALIANMRRNRLKLCSGAFVNYAVEVARRMGMSREELGVMAYVASIHDVGMVRIGRRLVESSCRFGEKEMELLRRHPEEGIEIVRPIEFMEQVYELILCHHERVDGTGYPRGLRGYQIPLGSRILAVVDAYESMRIGRPYRVPLEEADAIEELKRCAGKQFDEEVVDTLVQAITDEKLSGTVCSPAGRGRQRNSLRKI
ncbi:MAG: GAF domain-containing protein [Candidatus Eiseniibacteriota bacterium]|nr:MAG: GAF domain-containing protein [Candidatus Eisenbacteria bacterium]